MKYLVALALVVTTCVPIAPASTSENSTSYSTMWLIQWVYNCSQLLAPTYEMRGMNSQFALQKSIYDCSCVVDKFRQSFSQPEVENMSVEDRRLFSEQFTIQCLNGLSS